MDRRPPPLPGRPSARRSAGARSDDRALWLVQRASIVLAVLLLLATADARPVHAHAQLIRSEPAAGAVLPASPQAIVLLFSEELDPGLAAVRLLNARGAVVVDGPGMVEPEQALELRLDLPSLPDGTYSAVWQVRSAVDGHVTGGTVGFSIGAASPAASRLPPPGTPDPATALPAPVDVLLRWSGYLAAALGTGTVLFGLLVWRPVCHAWQSCDETADRQATRTLVRLSLLGSVVLFLLTAVAAVLVMLEAREAAGGGNGAELFAGRIGTLFLVRLVLLALLAGTATRLPPVGRGPLRLWGLAAALGAAILSTFSLISHSAALGGGVAYLATGLDWLHLVAMATWFGGLLPLGLLLWQSDARSTLFRVLIPRFSAVALASTVLLALTGTFTAVVQVRTPEALALTTYGRALILKLGLFGLLLLLGAANLFLLSPRLRDATARAVGGLRRTVGIELAVAALLLLTVGVLVNVQPASQALQAQRRLGLVEPARVDDVRLVLRIAPLAVGDNEFAVDLVDPRPGAVNSPAIVLLRLTMLEHDMGTLQVETMAREGGRYAARGSYLSVAGPWQVEVIVRRAGFDDVRHTFDLVVPLPADAG